LRILIDFLSTLISLAGSVAVPPLGEAVASTLGFLCFTWLAARRFFNWKSAAAPAPRVDTVIL
jgi:hypothetical protein